MYTVHQDIRCQRIKLSSSGASSCGTFSPTARALGGTPANVAWHLGQAGGWARLVTRVGDDEPGRRAIAELSDLVDTSLVQIDPERATGEVDVTLVGGEARYRLRVPAARGERIEDAPSDAREALEEAGVAIYGTLAQRLAAGLARLARRRWPRRTTTVSRVCDVNLRKTETMHVDEAAAVLAALERADVVKVNDRELATLGDWLGWADPIAQLRKGPGPRVVAVTHGADGSTLFGDAGAIEIAPVAARRGGDNVGCGDAYLAILVHGMTLGWDLASSPAAPAGRWAAAVAEVRGATPRFEAEQISDLLELEAV